MKQSAYLLLLSACAVVGQTEVDRVRQVNLARAAAMPSFVADETSEFSSRQGGAIEWKHATTIESEVAVKNAHITRQHQIVDGKPSKKSVAVANVGFGEELHPLFSPECRTTVDFERREEIRGAPALVFGFRTPAKGCFGAVGTKGHLYNPARSGQFWADEATGMLVRFDEEMSEFPKDFPFVQRNQTESWGLVKIGDDSSVLPVAIDVVWLYPKDLQVHLVIAYKNHRHFEASTKVTFADGVAAPK